MGKSFPRIELPGVTPAERTEVAELKSKANAYQLLSFRLYQSLIQQGKHVYMGTVPGAEKARRRAADKVAGKSRRVNRGNR